MFFLDRFYRQKTLIILKICLVVIGLCIFLSLTSHFTANAKNELLISWWTVDGGGRSSMGRDYLINVTIGQPDAGAMSGGGYTLHGGFLPGGALSPHFKLYLPVVMR